MPGTLNVAPLRDALEQAGVEYEVLFHPRTETATAEAAALGLRPHEVAKTIVVSTPTGNVRAVMLASDRLDMHKLREFVGGAKETHLLTEADLQRDYPEFELGAVPPLGGRSDQVILDRRLSELENIVVEAGAHDQSVRLRTQDLIALASAQTADICLD